jgi:hypothetical protein
VTRWALLLLGLLLTVVVPLVVLVCALAIAGNP